MVCTLPNISHAAILVLKSMMQLPKVRQ